MLTPEQFGVAWGKDDLVLVPACELEDVDIPQADKDFLMQAGLPRRAAIPTGGAGDFVLLPLEIIAEAETNRPQHSFLSVHKASQYLVGFIEYEPYFGHDTYFCSESKSGGIRLVDNQDDVEYFVNSSISTFAEALLVYRSFIAPSQDDPIKDNDRSRLRRLKQEIKALDPTAFSKRVNYWPVMLADLANQI